MLKNLYVLIIIIIPLVQIALCKNPLSKNRDMRNVPTISSDAKFFDSVVEGKPFRSTTKKPLWPSHRPNAIMNKREPKPKQDKVYHDIRVLLSKVLDQLVEIEKNKREDTSSAEFKPVIKDIKEQSTQSSETEKLRKEGGQTGTGRNTKKKKKDEGRHTRWGHWTDWSSCSVSCGKGRQIRWRHCLEHCEEAETEMEEKTCQLPACGPGKLFGVIKI